MNSGKIFLSVLAGAAAGAIAGILLAPAKGSKTRKDILNKGEDYVDSVKGKMDHMFDTFSRKFDKVKAEATDFAEKAKEDAAHYAEKVKEGASAYAEKKMPNR